MKCWPSLFLLLAVAPPLHAADEVDYERDVKPLLAEKCSACHGPLQQEAGLRLDAGKLIRKGSEDGPVIVPGKPAESLLIQKVTAAEPTERMPPEGEGAPLNAKQIALLKAWISGGATVPADEVVVEGPDKHWAYQTPTRPDTPPVDDARWSQAIDAFLQRERLRLGVTPVDEADRYTLLRRVSLDLTGLPPTRKEIQEFLQDESSDAWLKVVDRLLASPQYGERWGRHWMDVWRYSDWDGYKNELRGSQRHIWRWRDWIVDSLNADKGYDRMLVEMLAGDEVAPDDPSVLPATGFLARNFHKSNRNMWLDATVEHTAKAFLGLTINCARCHDHKYDPVPQPVYYQFRAIFEPHNVRADRIPGQADVMQDALPRAFDADLEAQTYLYLAGNEKHPDKENPVSPAVPDFLRGEFKPQPVELPVEAYYPWLQDFIVEEQLAAARKQLEQAEQALATAAEQTSEAAGEEAKPAGDVSVLERKRTVAELNLQSLEARQAADRAKYVGGEAEQVQQLARTAADLERRLNLAKAQLTVDEKAAAQQTAEAKGQEDEKQKQAAVDKAKKELADAKTALEKAQEAAKQDGANYTPLGKEYPRTSSGRRLALARWITSKDNPLTARVAVNHIWMRHFGAPLVANVFDFGLRSPRPRHADLLDWLAVELIENNWSMKHVHRLIVSSATYRLSSSAGDNDTSSAEIDRDNHTLWRMNVRRLDAEVVRDSVLAVSGQLETVLGGPDIDFQQGETSRRRSIYLRHAYEKQNTMLVLFDAANPNDCYRRSESIVPQQALALSNSSLSLGQSRLLARKLWEEVSTVDDAEARLTREAFLQVLSRPPSDEELSACLQFVKEQTTTLSDPSKLTTFVGGGEAQVNPSDDPHLRALENLVHVLMNHNDFVTVR